MAHLGGRLQLSVPDPLYDVEGRPYHTTDCSRQPQTPLHWPAPLDLSCSAGQEHFNRVPLHHSFEDTKILAPSSTAMNQVELAFALHIYAWQTTVSLPLHSKSLETSPLISLARSHHLLTSALALLNLHLSTSPAISASHEALCI